MIKKILLTLLFLIVPFGTSAQFIQQGPQGGTGIGTTHAEIWKASGSSVMEAA